MPTEVNVERDIPFASVDGHRLLLDLYRSPIVDAPVVVYVHGGGWTGGDRTTEGPTRVAPLATHGVTVASVDYRLAPDSAFPAQVHDVKAAVRWLRAHGGDLGLRTERLGIWGASAGAYLASLVGLSPGDASLEGDVGGDLGESSAVQAVVHWFGPADLASSGARSGPEAKLLPFRFEAELLAAADQENLAERARDFSLLRRITAAAPPFLIAHGDRDRIVSPSQSFALFHALAHGGGSTRLELLADAGHEDPAFDAGPSLAMTAAWLREQLR
jgi:acetyl esterase/lipase